MDRPGTFLGTSLTSQAFLFDSQGPVELGGEVFHLHFPAKGRMETGTLRMGVQKQHLLPISLPAAFLSEHSPPTTEHLPKLEKINA